MTVRFSIILDEADQPVAQIVIGYDDAVGDPEAILKDVATFAGRQLNFDPDGAGLAGGK